MIKIQIDGAFYEVKTGNNLLHTLLALGFDIPYFCFHPAMGSVGACRQCAVKKFKDESDKKGKIIMSCMEPVSEGLIVSTNDEEIIAFRAAIIESLMTNHPHDCPVCDEGGECHLQDMTVMTGHNYRRFNFKKRTYRNQYLGPFIHQEMNRCIQCYRCLRFYKEYAGGNDFDVFGSASHVFFGRHKDGILENEFSGNLVEVCPTGVFTDKTFRQHFTRKWDLTNAPSICVHCSLGCNIIVSERYGTVRRVLSRFNNEINGYFLCDRGRFGYEFLNNQARVTSHLATSSSKKDQKEITREEGLALLKKAVKGKNLAAIGSPRASLEANYALEKLVGRDNFYHGIADKEYWLTKTAIQILRSEFVHSPSLKDIGKADAILILGEDPQNSAPMLALSLRQATRNRSFKVAAQAGIPAWNDTSVRVSAQKERIPMFILTPFRTKLDDLAELTIRSAPEDAARIGFKVATAISDGTTPPHDQIISNDAAARRIAEALMEAENPVIVTGLGSLEESLLYCASNIALALSNKGKKASVSVIFPESNSVGLGLMAGSPFSMLADNTEKNKNTLIILENDLMQRVASDLADSILDKFGYVIVLDHISTGTTLKADLVIPSAPFAESTGTIVNNEGRAQRYYRVLPVNEHSEEAWKTLAGIMKEADLKDEFKWTGFDDIVNSFTDDYPLFYKVKQNVPDSGTRFFNEKIPRQTPRFSGRTAIHSNIEVSESKPPSDNDSPLAFTMEGYRGIPPSSYLVPFYWSPGWNSVQAMNRYMDEPDGIPFGGASGVKLFSETTGKSSKFLGKMPPGFKPDPHKTYILPVHIIFGSEELSSLAGSLSGLIPDPFIILNEKERKRLINTEGDMAKVTVNKISIIVKIVIDNSISDGITGLSYIFGKTPYSGLPSWGTIEEARQT